MTALANVSMGCDEFGGDALVLELQDAAIPRLGAAEPSIVALAQTGRYDRNRAPVLLSVGRCGAVRIDPGT